MAAGAPPSGGATPQGRAAQRRGDPTGARRGRDVSAKGNPALPLRVREGRPFYEGLALGILVALSLRALLPTLFYLSLATLRLNGTAIWMLALGIPALAAPLLARAPARAARWLSLLAGAAVATLPLAHLTPNLPPLAALAAAVSLTALVAAPRESLPGALVGVAIGIAAVITGPEADPLLHAWGFIVPLLLGGFAFLVHHHDAPPAPAASPPHLLAGIAWATVLLAEMAYLASPHALAAHLRAPAWAAGAAALAGLVAGMLLADRARAWLALAAVALVDVALAWSPLGVLSLALVQAGIGFAAARLPRPHAWTFGPTLAAASFGVLFFGQTLGSGEWRLLLPLLAAPALLTAFLPGEISRIGARAVAPLALAALLLIPSVVPAAPPPEPASDELRVVNWNVHQGFGNRGGLDPTLYAAVLRDLEPDIVILQEAYAARLSSGGIDMLAYLARELRMHPIRPAPGVAILTLHPLAQDAAPASEGWTVRAPLDVDGRTVWVQGVHLARSSSERVRQAETLLAIANMTDDPIILAGDLNSCPTNTCFGGRPSDGIHERLATGFDDTWTVHADAEDPRGNTHPAWEPRRRIDVIMVRDMEVISSEAVRDTRTTRASDHLPVLARLRLPTA